VTRLAMEEFAAVIGIDWADAKHDIRRQVTGSATRAFSVLEHRPDTSDEGVSPLARGSPGNQWPSVLNSLRAPSSRRCARTLSLGSSPSLPSYGHGIARPSPPARSRTTP
jgi:hypothetical protein